MVYHNTRSLACRAPAGAVPAGTELVLRLLGAREAERASLRVTRGGRKEEIRMRRTDPEIFEARVKADGSGLMLYDFAYETADGSFFYGAPEDGLGGEGQIAKKPLPFRITVYAPDYRTPEYMRRGIMYQIFPDRFARSAVPEKTGDDMFVHEDWDSRPILMPDGETDNTARDFYGGSFEGIRLKLPYLKSLGVTLLYLNPIFQARSNHRYDTGDYTKTDPMLGTEAEFERLTREAASFGIRVILDGVFSHTGDDSLYFNRYGRYPSVGACQGEESPYYSWYTFKHFPDEYACWWGIKNVPTVNKADESYRDFILGPDGIARLWLRRGASGWRLDVADELPVPFLRSLRRAVKAEKRDALLLGEVWEDASCKEAYGEVRCYCAGDMLDSVMNYPLREALIAFLTGQSDAYALARLILSQQENYPVPFYYSLMNLLGSHDRPRTINVLAGKSFEDLPFAQRAEARLTKEEYELGKKRYLKMLCAVCALPGTPCLYYGDEAGLWGASDPWCRGTYPWGHEDRELLEGVRGILRFRRDREVLQTGFLNLVVRDADRLLILRSFEGGRDAFGEAREDESLTVEIDRREG